LASTVLGEGPAVLNLPGHFKSTYTSKPEIQQSMLLMVTIGFSGCLQSCALPEKRAYRRCRLSHKPHRIRQIFNCLGTEKKWP